jgi:flagellar motor component MotA
MKIAQIVFAITAITCVVTIFNLAASGDLHPFFARAYLGIVYATWIFLALMSYHFKRPKK